MMMMSKFALVLLVAAALCVTTVTAYTGGGKIRNTDVSWTTSPNAAPTAVKFTITTNPAPPGYLCIGMVYGTGNAHNDMDSICIDQNKFYRGYCGGGKSTPNFQNIAGNAGGNAAGMGLLTAMTLVTNNGNQIASWTRPLANTYAGAEDIRVATPRDGRFLDEETFFEPNKEYMLWIALQSDPNKRMDQYHDSSASMPSPLFSTTQPPLAKPTCTVYLGLWGGCPDNTSFTGVVKPDAPAECRDQNGCTQFECCVRRPPPPTPPTPVVTYTPTPPPVDGLGPNPLDAPPRPSQAHCPDTYFCRNQDWEKLVDHGDNLCSGTTIDSCSDADCCTCMTKAKGNICAQWRKVNQLSTQADIDNENAAFGVSPSFVTVVFALVAVVVMIF